MPVWLGLDSTRIVSVVVLLLAACLYWLTLSAGVGWHDSAELALRAHQLGASHSPGSPLHALVGFIFNLFVDSPARATNLLSATSMALAATCLALLITRTNGKFAILSALIFATSYQVWANAVVTELYGSSTLCMLLASIGFWLWLEREQRSWLILGLFSYVFALGFWFANILLLPAIVWLLWARQPRSLQQMFWPGLIVVFGLAGIVVTNIWLSQRIPPFGPDVPNSIAGIIRYMSGSMHDPLTARGIDFYWDRTREHFSIFGRNFLWIGLFPGLVGIVDFTRRHLVFGGYLIACFAIQMAYFTWFGSGDYYTMVVFAYALYCFWIAHGITRIVSLGKTAFVGSAILLLAILGVLVSQQLTGRVAAARSAAVQEFIDQSFRVLPENALAIAGWQQFTALAYGQGVQQLRPDVEILLPALTARHYGNTRVLNYLELIDASYCDRPILTHKAKDELNAEFILEPLPESDGWYLLQSGVRDQACSADLY